MSTLKTTNLQHPSAVDPAIVLDADGDVTYSGVHDFSAATVTGAPQGLVHIATETFSAVSSVSLNDVFTSDYDNYRIIVRSLAVAASSFILRMRLSGADNTAAQYDVYGYYGGDGAGNIRTVTDTSWGGTVSGSPINNWTFDLMSPSIAIETQGIGASFVGTNSGSGFLQNRALVHRAATAYDGISIIYSQNSTGRISVYGYSNGA